MARQWTEAQKQAIEARDGTVLVSAAAGSGKTAVLVERVIERITDAENPVDIEKLLIVTFTKAAAAEMKERISKRLSEMICEQPKNQYLKRQKMYLPNAQISTMDSFCGKLVKENFEKADVAPDYTMLSDIEHDMLKREVINEVLEELYSLPKEETEDFLRLFTNGRNDENLISSILTLYDFAMASANPEQWIEKCFEPYFSDLPLEKTEWGKFCLNQVCDILKFANDKAYDIVEDAPKDGKLEAFITEELYGINNISATIWDMVDDEDGAWDEIKERVDSIALGRWPRLSAEEVNHPHCLEIKKRREGLKKYYSAAQDIMICTEKEYREDIEYLRPIVNVFKKCVLRFVELLNEKKTENNSYYFSDILHFSLKLLVDFKNDGTSEKTQLATELSENFAEILIDEFQDTNEAQDTLFRAISKNESNVFMVGDVKQSVYRFRQAMPEIFVNYKDIFKPYSQGEYPATICLDKNFRSRKGVVEGINFFFEFFMTEKLGGVKYSQDGEKLVFGGNYEESNSADVAVHLVDTDKSRGTDLEAEARHIGNVINELISSGTLVGKKGEERPIKYSDICILLRAVKNKAPIIANELKKMGIPAHFQKQGGFFESSEIVTMFSMLQVIDNPVQDVPLVSVMLSPLFPFTEDDLAKYRCEQRKGSFYSVVKNQYDKDEKVKEFLDLLSVLRTLSVTMDAGSLIRRVLEITSYNSIVGAMDNGEKRVLNLELLINYAENYEANGGSGLSGFIRYLEKVRKNNKNLEGANEISENDDVVRIMSIHKSKGLEFPVVFLANCSASFNVADYNKVRLHRDLGVGFTRYFSNLNKEFSTQPHSAIKLANKYEETAELIRLLYVAMTRAEEKLYLVGSMYNWDKKIDELYYTYYNDNINSEIPLMLINSFMQWILLRMLWHPSMGFKGEFNFCYEIPTRFLPKIEFRLVDNPSETEEYVEKEKSYMVDEKIVSNITTKLSYQYPFSSFSDILAKYAASSMNEEANLKYLATENPTFSGAGELTPAQRGTVNHKFMEVCDFTRAVEDLTGEINRLVENNIFTQKEVDALKINSIKTFFSSELFARIQGAEKFLREQEFTMNIPVNEINPDLPKTTEKAVVQGVIDALLINGDSGEIIDYKTDRVENEDELIERYRSQMSVYKKAAEECFGLENVKVTLYSFSLSKEISLKL